MTELDKALADILAIRTQIARSTTFFGYGPVTLAATGGLAALSAAAQQLWLAAPTEHPLAYFATWIATAVLALACIGVEVVTRSRRLYSRLADAMILTAADQFLPAGAAGACLGLVLWRCSPDNLWMLPGLWQILVSMGLFAASRALPRGIVLAAGWYCLSGLGVLALASADHALSPWSMGLPFAVGQGLMGLVLHRSGGGDDA